IFCKSRNHQSSDCQKAFGMPMEEKQKKIQEAQACFKCYRTNHRAKNCKVKIKCSVCTKQHYPNMCSKLFGGETSSDTKREEKKTSDHKLTTMASQSSVAPVQLETI